MNDAFEAGVLILLGSLYALEMLKFITGRHNRCKWVRNFVGCSYVNYSTDCDIVHTWQNQSTPFPNKCPYCGRKVKLS